MTTGATFTVVALTTLLPSVNGDALTGAFAGAALFAMNATDLPMLKRLAYMLLSLVVGYFAADEVMHWTGIQHYFAASFLVAATVVTLMLYFLDKVGPLVDTFLIRRR